MASTYSTSLKLELQATGENAGTWGTKTNTNLQLVEQAVGGYEEVSICLLYTSPSPRDGLLSRMPSSA